MDNVFKVISSAVRGLRYNIQTSNSESKGYTDKKARETLSKSKAYTDEKASTTLTESKAYTDEKVKEGLPAVSASDNGKFLRVSNGAWAAEAVPNAEEGSY